MRVANGKHYALVIKRMESGVWVVGLRGHLVSEREVNNAGSVLSESRPVYAVARSSLGGTTCTLHAMWGECESACCHGNKAAPQSPVPIKKDGWQRGCGSMVV